MSDATPRKEEVKKNKGKLPVLIVIAAMLFTGGFFGMKLRSGDRKEPEVKLGKIVEFEEKLYNLSDMQTWLRMTVAVHLKDGYDDAKFKENVAPVEDAMNLVVRGKSPSQIQTVTGLQAFKKELVEKINSALMSLEPNERKKEVGTPVSEVRGTAGKTTKPDKSERKPDNVWESQTGPVLKIYFRAFAVQ